MRSFAFPAVVMAGALVSACASPDTSRRAADRSATTPAASERVATSGGTLGSGGPGDSITERADRGRIMGDSTATVWFIMASDFQCPWCKRWHDATFATIVQNYVRTGKIRMAYLNFPLGMHRNAVPAAEAAMCAAAQGKFWPMHDALFADQEKWGELPNPDSIFSAMAVRTGVSMAGWRECVSKHSTMSLIAADRERASSAGVRSTPVFFVGDRQVVGAGPYEMFRDTIEAVLAKGRGTGTSPKPPSP